MSGGAWNEETARACIEEAYPETKAQRDAGGVAEAAGSGGDPRAEEQMRLLRVRYTENGARLMTLRRREKELATREERILFGVLMLRWLAVFNAAALALIWCLLWGPGRP